MSPLRLASLFVVLAAGCASGGDDAPVTAGKDAGADTGGPGAVDAPAPACSPGAKESLPCGKCGNHEHTCQGDGTWGAFGACSGEKSGPFVCALGETRTSACGKCGASKDTCDDSCTWVPGTCAGEGECQVGEVDKSPCVTGGAGEVRSRTCGGSCKWGEYGVCAAPAGWKKLTAAPGGFEARVRHSAVWTGKEMIVFGGQLGSATKGDGASYSLGVDSWKPIAAGKPRSGHVAVWTGTEMIVWGGVDATSYLADGARYDPATGTWKAMTPAPIPARDGATAVWSTTTSELLVWGGYGGCGGPCADGAAYDPATDKWTTLPAAPIGARSGHVGVWSGKELVVWGGGGSSGVTAPLDDGATYDPKTKAWTKLPAVPTGFDGRFQHVGVFSDKELLIWGGYGGVDIARLAKTSGARVAPGATSWTPFANLEETVLASAARYNTHAFSIGGRLYVWSGQNPSFPTGVAGGAVYDVATDKWSKMDVTGGPEPRVGATVVNTGKEAILWGGCAMLGDPKGCFANGALYRP